MLVGWLSAGWLGAPKIPSPPVLIRTASIPQATPYPSGFLPQYDFNVLGFGQHPAAGCCCCWQDGHWPFLRYVQYVHRLMPLLKDSLRRRKVCVLMWGVWGGEDQGH